MTYDEAIEKFKEKFKKELKNTKGRFWIESGELWYEGWACPDMNGYQQFINEILGQKTYRATYTGYKEVYAKDEEEARIFLEYTKRPTPFLTKVTEVI